MVNDIAKTETPIESADDSALNEATTSAVLSEEEINNLINEILATVPEATSQATLAENINIPNNLLISNSLNIGGTMTLADNSLNTLSGPLYLQSLGLGGIDILAGKIIIDEHGNATFEGNVTIKGDLAVNTIKPLPEKDLVIDLAQIPINNEFDTSLDNPVTESAFGKLLVKGFDGQVVASIDASGSARFAEVESRRATFAKLNIAAPNTSEVGLDSSEVSTNATAGQAILPANESEITIKSPFVTENTLIYVTPISSTQNKVIYVKAKKAQQDYPDLNLFQDSPGGEPGWFKVGIDTTIDKEIRFNWWIIN